MVCLLFWAPIEAALWLQLARKPAGNLSTCMLLLSCFEIFTNLLWQRLALLLVTDLPSILLKLIAFMHGAAAGSFTCCIDLYIVPLRNASFVDYAHLSCMQISRTWQGGKVTNDQVF